MSRLLSDQARRVIEAPLRVTGGRVLVGDALWLYVTLASIANFRGIVCRRSDRLAEGLAIEESRLTEWLSRLETAGLVELQSGSPFLVIKLNPWSGSPDPGATSGPDSTRPAASLQSEVPVSSSVAAAASSNREDGGQGEGEALFAEVQAVLGDTDAAEFRDVHMQYAPAVVRQALRRVQTTPAAQIRKSKAALFRYLLAKLS